MRYLTIADGRYLDLARKAQAEAKAFGDVLEIVTPKPGLNAYKAKIVAVLAAMETDGMAAYIDADTSVVGALPPENAFDQNAINMAEISPGHPSTFAFVVGPGAKAELKRWLRAYRQYAHISPYDAYSLRRDDIKYKALPPDLYADERFRNYPTPKWILHHRISLEKSP